MIGGKTHHHGAHAKGQPAPGIKVTHAGINQRIARPALLPGGKARCGVVRPLFQRMIGRMKRAEFRSRFIFQLLDEMAVPVQTAFKALDRAGPAMTSARALRLTFLPRLAHRNAAKGQIG